MAENIGIVIKAESGNYTQVVTDRKSACGGCQSTPGGCRSCLVSARMVSRVANPVGAEVGDLVKIHLSSTNLATGAAILYLLPILGLLIGAFTGSWVSSLFPLTEIFGSIGGAIAGLVVGYAAVITLDRSPSLRRQITPTITSIVVPNVVKASCHD
ncbi:MAG: SoxR reducing system RseC family protein [Deltaproteobacteria bacterium]|nr:SoxR reducing system RseC family protein [Deltaproteobacteria bacterium]